MTQVSSTGNLGFALRSDERAYYSYNEAVTTDNLGTFYGDLTDHLLTVGSEIEDTTVTRAVMRTVMGDTALSEVLTHPGIARYIEAAAPLPATSDGAGEYLVYFARNAAGRSMDEVTRNEFLSRVAKAKDISLSGKAIAPLDPGYRLTTQVNDPTRLNELWSETFGWDKEGCIDFAKRLDEETRVLPEDRTVWFRGLEDENGVLQAAAMAERLDVPATDGQIALVEHTEWATHPSQRGKGLGRHVVSALTTDVKADLDGVRHLIFAECNLTSGAHVVAAHSGFTVPSIETPHGEVGQVLCHNVRVSDGHEPHGGYRNFMFTVVR